MTPFIHRELYLCFLSISIYFCKLCEHWLTKALYTVYIYRCAALVIYLHPWNALKITAENRCWKRNLNTHVAYYRMGSWCSSMAFPWSLKDFVYPPVSSNLAGLAGHRVIWKLWDQIWKLWTADSETMMWKLWLWFRNSEQNADSETMIQKLRHLIWKLCRKPWVGNYEWETFAGKSATEKSNTDFPNTDFALCHVFSTPEISAA